MFAALIPTLLFFPVIAAAADNPNIRQETYFAESHTGPSLNVSSCPGLCFAHHTLSCRDILRSSERRTSACTVPAIMANVSTSGYKVVSEKQTSHGLIVQLMLAGPACNAFGHDIVDLTVEITYETVSRCATYVLSFHTDS
ncbi:hypothetical protein NUW54_g2576 [Trametes sanguinea]|uniref:Uncharacterized protein n=1 Tax=Trametes sanguinea TaxID=158606 RepID=A0ACC1Q4I8_9APHY|nr:hypothetical protein NUW54_g2576 [Trametes sanguinea]